MVGRSTTRRGISSGIAIQSLLVRTLYVLSGFIIIGSAPRFGWIWLGGIAGDLNGGKREQHVRVGWRFALCWCLRLGSRTKLTEGVECVHRFRHVFFRESLGSILTLWLSHSGLGTSDASLEVDEVEVCLLSSQPAHYADAGQSPPTEENTIEEEPSRSIYERHMYLKKHGFPLWIPQPNLRLSCSYRRRGVSIGDVGIFTAGGGFDFLFNICLPAGHPSNPDELPEGFCCLQLKPADVCEFRAHSSRSYIASSSVKKQG